MRSCARRRSHREERKKRDRTETARNRTAEGQQPDRVDEKVRPVGMDESVSHKGPHVGTATGKRVTEHDRTVVAHGDERECQQKFDILLLAEKIDAHDVNEYQHGQHSKDYARNVENRFAFHGRIRWNSPELRRFTLQRKTGRSKRKGRAFALHEPRCGGCATLDGWVTSYRLPMALNKNRCAKICTGSVTWISES